MGKQSLVRIALAGLAAALLGCAVAPPALRPADLPLHGAHDGFAALHWRVDRRPDTVVADGVVEVFQPERIAQVVIELQGLDAAGRIVSRARDYASPRSFTGVDPWPFEVRLRPRGGEERFALRVAELVWKPMRAGP
jgi:hypothetical protein